MKMGGIRQGQGRYGLNELVALLETYICEINADIRHATL